MEIMICTFVAMFLAFAFSFCVFVLADIVADKKKNKKIKQLEEFICACVRNGNPLYFIRKNDDPFADDEIIVITDCKNGYVQYKKKSESSGYWYWNSMPVKQLNSFYNIYNKKVLNEYDKVSNR